MGRRVRLGLEGRGAAHTARLQTKVERRLRPLARVAQKGKQRHRRLQPDARRRLGLHVALVLHLREQQAWCRACGACSASKCE